LRREKSKQEREKSKNKNKTFAMGTIIQSIFVNEVVTLGWVKLEGKSSQPPEANEGFKAESS